MSNFKILCAPQIFDGAESISTIKIEFKHSIFLNSNNLFLCAPEFKHSNYLSFWKKKNSFKKLYYVALVENSYALLEDSGLGLEDSLLGLVKKHVHILLASIVKKMLLSQRFFNFIQLRCYCHWTCHLLQAHYYFFPDNIMVNVVVSISFKKPLSFLKYFNAIDMVSSFVSDKYSKEISNYFWKNLFIF